MQEVIQTGRVIGRINKGFMTLSAGLALGVLFSATASHAEEGIRTWTSLSGKTVEARYESWIMDSVRVVDADGNILKLSLEELSEEDVEYVELMNPPEIKVEYEESAPVREYVADAWIPSGGGWIAQNNPIYIIEGRFGARVKKTSSRPYDHELTITMMIFSVQNMDRDKYHLILRSSSQPFKLNKDNRYTFTYTDPNVHDTMFYDLSGKWPRGEKLGEYLILVYDKQGKVIAHRSSGNWLFNNHEKLMDLKVGFWVNDDGDQVYPTTPKRLL